MSKDELIVRLIFANINLRDENINLKKKLSNSIPVCRDYTVGDLSAILENVVEGNKQ
jgi:hypothetical protein